MRLPAKASRGNLFLSNPKFKPARLKMIPSNQNIAGTNGKINVARASKLKIKPTIARLLLIVFVFCGSI